MDIVVKAKVKHNGRWYEPGESIKKVKKEDGDRLIQLDAAVEEKVETKQEPPKE